MPAYNPEQLQAIKHRGSPLRILAGAGTGKTATLAGRFVSYVDSNEAAVNQILALTFTRKAAREMKERIIDQLNRSYTEFWVETFHSFCMRVLRHERALLGQGPPIILQEHPRTVFLREAIEGHSFPSYGVQQRELIQQALRFIDRAKDELKFPNDAVALAEQRGNQQLMDLARAYSLYQVKLRNTHRLHDWGELQLRVIELLLDDEIRNRWRDRFRFVLVDEYQDVNRAQSRIIELLTGDGSNLTVVGDVDQSIYAFRGASHRFLAEFDQQFPGTRTIHLTSNFRSRQPILDAGNALIKLNEEVLERRPLVAVSRQEAELPTVIEVQTEQEEADAIARQVARLHFIDGVPLGDIAILLRSVHVAAGPIDRALADYGIRSTLTQDTTNRGDAVADVLAVLRLIDDPADSGIVRIITAQGIDPLQILAGEIAPVEEETGLVERLAAIDPDSARLVRKALADIAALAPLPLPEQVYQAAHICQRLPLKESISRDDYRYVQELSAMIERATQIAESDGDRTTFIAELEEQTPLPDDALPSESAVQILTMHSAKGLEFRHVFVAGMAQGRFPLQRRLDHSIDLSQPDSIWIDDPDLQPDDVTLKLRFLEEERRLGYVALTRAIERLYLSWAHRYDDISTGPPVFLNDIKLSGSELLNKVVVATEDESILNARDLAHQHRQRIDAALEQHGLSGDAIADLMLGQLALTELPGVSPWRPHAEPFPYDGSESLRLSYTALTAYEDCPRQYYYRYVLHLPDDRFSAYARRGTIVHDTIRWINQQRKQGHFPTWGEVHMKLDADWDATGFESVAQELQVRSYCEHVLARYHAWESKRNVEVVDAELAFDLPFGNHQMVGQIDCVVRHTDGTYEIIDFKSGKPAGTIAQRQRQLGIYTLAYRDLNPVAGPRASLCFLGSLDDRDGQYAQDFMAEKQYISAELDEDKLDALREYVAETASKILRNEFPVTNSSYSCTRCAYRHLCQGANDGN